MNTVEIKKDIYWVGALDPKLRIFDIIMYTPFGTSYNSYLVKGSKKTAIIETVKVGFFDQYLEELHALDVNIQNIDYIVVNHTEPDHAGSVAKLLDIAKKAKVVGSSSAIKFLKAIVNRDFESITVKDGDSISLGNKTLKFISAPLLHWPDSIYTYLSEDKMLFTCDSFGSHYCSKNIFNDLNENEQDYLESLKYYFDCIMSPFKPYVLKAINKIKDLKIEYICTGHGPILRKDPWKIVELYKEWSTPEVHKKNNVVISYVSAYGYTESMANKIAEGINSYENFNVDVFNVIYSDKKEIAEKISKADGLLFGSPTINGNALEPILNIIDTLSPIVHGGITTAAFGSYGWSGEAVPAIEHRLKDLRMNLLQGLKVNFKPSDSELELAFNFGKNFAVNLNHKLNKGNVASKTTTIKKWKCIVCGEVFEGAEPPAICPACGASSDQFIEVKDDVITFNSDKKEKFIIIGNGAAGYYASSAIRSRNNCSEIQIISSEKILSYYRPQLSNYLSNTIPDEMFYISPLTWYKENNIGLTLNTTVTKIKTDAKSLILSDGKEISYDKLIIANGSHNFIPPLKGIDKSNVYTLKSVFDADNIKDAIHKSKNAVVIGGGLLGLEAAWEISKSGVKVSVVEFMNRLLPMQLDEESAEILKNCVNASNIDIILGDSVEEILGGASVSGVKLKSSKVLESDLVIFSVGIRPNKELAEGAGILAAKGITVNEKMETNIPGIYACGDVAEINGRVFGNWPSAIEMGKVAGANASGDDTSFKDFVPSSSFNAMNIEIFSCGDVATTSQNSTQVELKNISQNIYKKLFFKDNRLVGGILIGDVKDSVKIMSRIRGLAVPDLNIEMLIK